MFETFQFFRNSNGVLKRFPNECRSFVTLNWHVVQANLFSMYLDKIQIVATVLEKS